MTGGRLLRYLVVWLLLMPVVMAASDTAQQAANGSFFKVPELRENERYVYDAVLVSEHHGLDVRVDSYVTFEVGEVQSRSVEGGEYEVFPVTTVRGWAPWDEFASTRPFMLPDGEDRWFTTTETAWLEPGSGRVVEHRELLEGWANKVEAGEKEPVSISRERVHYEPNSLESPFGWGMAPGQRVGAPVDGVMRALGSLFQAELPKHEKGSLEGVPVVNAKDWGQDPPGQQQGDYASCSLFYPEVWYQDFGLSKLVDGRPVWVDRKSDVWVSQEHALPVMQECRLQMRHINEEGALIEDLHFALVLREHEAGEDPVKVPQYTRVEAQLTGPLEAMDAVHSGVPAVSGGFAFPLRDAYEHALDADHEAIRALLSEDAGEIGVHSAQFQRIDHEGSGENVVPTGVIPDLTGDDEQEPAYTERWQLVLGHAGQEGAAATLERDLSAEDEPMETRLVSARERQVRFSPHQQSPEATPMVPFEDLIAHHEERTELEVDAFSLRWDFSDQDYRFATPHGSNREPAAAVGHEYRASDGALLVEWEREEAPAGSSPNPYQSRTQASTGFVPTVELGTAAIASGLVLTLIFALTYFSDAVLRFLVHGTLPLYAKVQRDKALDHPKRRAIHDLVTAQPGLSSKEVRGRMKIGHGTTMFHLATLEHVGLLSSRKVGRERAWFVPGQIHHRDQARTTLLSKPAVRRVYEAIGAHPGAHQAALADLLGVRPPSVRFHLKRLQDAGLVRGIREGRRTVYFLEAAPHQPRRETAALQSAAT